jgi:hypothetical protein
MSFGELSTVSGTVPLGLDIGATWSQKVRYRAAGNPVDMTGWTGSVVIVDLATGAVALSAPIVSGELEAGRWEMYLTPVQTSTLGAKKYGFRAEWVQPNGNVVWLLFGPLFCRAATSVG